MPRLSMPHGLPEEVLAVIDVIGNHARTELLHRLSAVGPSTAVGLAEDLGLPHASVHRHLQVLEEHGLVAADAPPGQRRGNKKVWWSAMPAAISALGASWVAYASAANER